MPVKNSYPEVPEIPYKQTTVDMSVVQAYAKGLMKAYQKKFLVMAYAIFRNESSNGTKGVNNNYAGIQADAGRWTNMPGKPVATCVKRDNGGAERRFLCFGVDGYMITLELLCIKAQSRDMTTAQDYFRKWVGMKDPSAEHIKNFTALLTAAEKIFS